MSEAIAPISHDQIIEQVVVQGDLGKLTAGERVAYYRAVCQSVGLNPLTKPFDYIVLNGRLTLYARKDCTDQLRQLKGISVEILAREKVDDLYIVTARASAPDGRHDEAIGAMNLVGLKGDAMANALMKAETKAKRRVTLSICGLGFLDESEEEVVASRAAAAALVNIETGAIQDVQDRHVALPQRQSEATETITPAQAKRFWTIAKQAGKTDEEMKAFLASMGIERTQAIRREIYDEVCAWAEGGAA